MTIVADPILSHHRCPTSITADFEAYYTYGAYKILEISHSRKGTGRGTPVQVNIRYIGILLCSESNLYLSSRSLSQPSTLCCMYGGTQQLHRKNTAASRSHFRYSTEHTSAARVCVLSVDLFIVSYTNRWFMLWWISRGHIISYRDSKQYIQEKCIISFVLDYRNISLHLSREAFGVVVEFVSYSSCFVLFCIAVYTSTAAVVLCSPNQQNSRSTTGYHATLGSRGMDEFKQLPRIFYYFS